MAGSVLCLKFGNFFWRSSVMATVHFETLGCKLNQIESESACKAFSDFGWNVSVENITSNEVLDEKLVKDTKLCVVNTCTVTTKAEQKGRHTINLLLKKFPFAVILVTGCYAQVKKDEIEKMDSRIVVLPGTKKDFLAELPRILAEKAETDIYKNIYKNGIYKTDTSINETLSVQKVACLLKAILESPESKNPAKFALSTDVFFNHSRSSIKIQDGCGNSCSFCAIHIARGKPVSLEADKVLERVLALEKAGQNEVVLTGVNLCQYRSLNQNFDIADLITYLSQNTSSINFRLSSLYPERIDEKFLSSLKKSRVRPHFHLSVQSGSDAILTRMNRPYSANQVREAVEKLRRLYQTEKNIEPFIACDIIVGFPSETEDDFLQTVKLCKDCNFSWIHAFPFSARPNTEAANMKNQIPQETARKRMNILCEIADNQKRAYIHRFEGKTVKAIVEKRHDGLCRCVTENFLHAHVNLSSGLEISYLLDHEIDVKITDTLPIFKECECECSVVLF